LWVIVGQNVIYVLVGFLCLFAVRYGEDEEAEEPVKVQGDHIVYQAASLVCVLIATDNLLRWLERGGNSNWFWLCSGSVQWWFCLGFSPWLHNSSIGPRS